MISERWRALIFPGGTEIGLELRQALAWCKEVELFSAGSSVSNHAPFVFARHFNVASVHETEWLDDLARVVTDQRITHIFPAHDDVVLALAENAAKLPAKIVSSPLTTCRITRSKSETARHLAGVVPVPQLFSEVGGINEFPVFVKPDRGQGSQMAAIANDREELDFLLKQNPSRIIWEFLPGREFTVDCFSDREKGLLYAAGRERRRVRSGIAMDSVRVEDPRFKEYALAIGQKLELYGAWFFQLKCDRSDELRLLEVAPRIGGTSALSRVTGVNLPLLSLYESDRIPIRILEQPFVAQIDRALTNRYKHDIQFDELYVDLDDTLVVHDRLNVDLVKLLFQAVGRGIRVILLTRCRQDPRSILERWRLTPLFDKIVHLKADESKADHISTNKAVLIDDSFSERLDVQTKRKIPVFDSGMVELLLDDRI